MKKNKKAKRKLNKKKIIIFIIFIFFIIFVIKLLNTNITNIYISGNKYLIDQEIIDISKLNNYSISIKNLSYKIEKRLQKNKYILSANVKKNFLLNKVYINIKENYPLFYYEEENTTILFDGTKVNDKLINTTIINYINNDILEDLIQKTNEIDINILNRISEIKYEPNDVYNDRFLLFMDDGNYVYIRLNNFNTLNKYLDIVKHIDSNNNGVIKLDSGGYFFEFDN